MRTYYDAASGPSTPSPRLSADAAEWHPPSFLAKTVEIESEKDQQPTQVDELKSETPSAAATTAIGGEQEACPGSNTPPRGDEGREDGSMPAPLPSSPPAISSDEPTVAVSPPADGSPSIPGDEQEREDGSMPAPPDSAQNDSTTASDEPTPADVLTTEGVDSGSGDVVGDDGAQPDGVAESDEVTPIPASDNAPSAPSTSEEEETLNFVPDATPVVEDCADAAADEVMATANDTAADTSNACCETTGEPTVAGLPVAATADGQVTPTDRCTVAEATAADTDVGDDSEPEVALSGTTGQDDKASGGEEGGDDTRGVKQLTDAASSASTETSRSDPDLPCGGGKGDSLGGKGDGGNSLLGDDGRNGGGLLDDPRWRWGSVAAVAAVVLLIGLRRR